MYIYIYIYMYIYINIYDISFEVYFNYQIYEIFCYLSKCLGVKINWPLLAMRERTTESYIFKELN
jgi:hypothetical protein